MNRLNVGVISKIPFGFGNEKNFYCKYRSWNDGFLTTFIISKEELCPLYLFLKYFSTTFEVHKISIFPALQTTFLDQIQA